MTTIKTYEINDLDEYDNSEVLANTLALAYCLNNYIEQHGESNQAFDVLRALVNLTIERLEQGKGDAQFTALNILTEARIPVPEAKSAGTRLSPVWNKLIDGVLPMREKGIQDFARNQGLTSYLWPEKDKSDGGRPSQYFLKHLSLSENEIPPVGPIEPGQIAYIRELTPEPSWWAKPLLKEGYRLEGWRRWLFLSYGVGTIVLGAIAVLLLWGLLWLTPSWSIKDLSMALFTAAFFIFSCWTSLYPFFRLLEWRIVMAPTSLVALGEVNVQMEIIRDLQLATKSPGVIRLVRYASICPQCKAKIEVVDGRKEFPNRLVGRCRENPGEHVYSFDRFTCKGNTLR